MMQQRNTGHDEVMQRLEWILRDAAWNVQNLQEAMHFLKKKLAGMYNKSYSLSSGISNLITLSYGFLFW
jgi:hypothetical protein